jgi:hypothetical protein
MGIPYSNPRATRGLDGIADAAPPSDDGRKPHGQSIVEEVGMSHHSRALAVLAMALPLAVGCSQAARDQRMSQAPSGEPPAVPAPGALIGPPTGWRSLTEGQAPVPLPDHPPVSASGVVASYDSATGIVRFEDGRMVKLTSQSKVVQLGGSSGLRPGSRIVVQNALPVGIPTEPTKP